MYGYNIDNNSSVKLFDDWSRSYHLKLAYVIVTDLIC